MTFASSRLVLIPLLFSSLAFASQFAPPVKYRLAENAYAVVAADFDHDGRLDLATANVSLPSDHLTISVLLGNGDGTFAPARNTGVNARSSFPAMASGDLNGDGNPDLVVVTTPTVIVLLGDGTGGFAPRVAYSTGGGAQWVALGDFNGDGKLDVVCPNSRPHAVAFLAGNGDGTLAAAVSSPLSVQPFEIQSGDFNHDGILDVVTSDVVNGKVQLLLGDGSGSFHLSFASNINVDLALAVTDFNGDGNLDVIVPMVGLLDVALFLGDGNGNLAPAILSRVTKNGGTTGDSIALADFDGDGNVDAVVGAPRQTLFYLRGDGTGNLLFTEGIGVGVGPISSVTADFNGDGAPDVATTSSCNPTVTVLLNTGAPSRTAVSVRRTRLN